MRAQVRRATHGGCGPRCCFLWGGATCLREACHFLCNGKSSGKSVEAEEKREAKGGCVVIYGGKFAVESEWFGGFFLLGAFGVCRSEVLN